MDRTCCAAGGCDCVLVESAEEGKKVTVYLNSFRRQLDPLVMRARYIHHVGDILASRRDDAGKLAEIRQLHTDFHVAHREWLALTDARLDR